MGGDVGVESTPGAAAASGSTARLMLADPDALDDAALEQTQALLDGQTLRSLEARLRNTHAGARVLLAEDNPANLEVSLELLRAAALRGRRGRQRATQAVDMARRHRYDLILMDVQMPGLDGLEATRQIRALPGHAHAGAGDDGQRLRRGSPGLQAAGMQDHIVKPVDPPPVLRHAAALAARRDLTSRGLAVVQRKNSSVGSFGVRGISLIRALAHGRCAER